MANDSEAIEKLTVTIEANITPLLKDTQAGVARIERELDRLSKTGKGSFEDVGKAAKLSGAQIGVLSGVVSGLVTGLIDLGKRGVEAMAELGRRSLDTAIEMDNLRARLLGIFDGSKEAANESFDFIQQKSKELGINLSELAGAFLPKVESLDQFERVAKLATALARSDPEQGTGGARIALIEALSGTFSSLQKRFELSKDDINRIKEFQAELGNTEGLIKGLEVVLTEGGKNFEVFADTAQGSFDRVGVKLEQAGGILATPIIESLEKAANNLDQFLSANEEDINTFLTSLGQSIASVIDFVSEIDFSQLDTQTLIDTAQFIFRIVEASQLFISQATAFINSASGVTDSLTLADEAGQLLVDMFSRLDEALVTASQILALAKAGYDGLYASIKPVVEILSALNNATLLAQTGDLAGAAEQLDKAVAGISEGVFDLEAGQEAARQSMLQSIQAFDEYQQSVDDQAASLEGVTKPAKGAADAILAQGQAARDAAEANEQVAEQVEKFGLELLKLQDELAEQTEKATEDHQKAMVDIEQEFAEKRADAAKDLAKDLAELEQDTAEKRADILKEAKEDLADLEADTDRKLEEERESFQIDEKRETEDHLREMRQLRRQYLDDLSDAVKSRDARAIVDLQKNFRQERQERRTDFEIEQSRKREDQDRNLQQIRQEEDRRAEEIIRHREEELRQLAENEAKKRQEIQLSYEEQMVQLAEAEAAKKESEIASYEERQAELDAAMAKRLEAIAEKLAEEKDINEEGAKAILEKLAEYFGEEGEIDNLMKAFRDRMEARVKITAEFESSSSSPSLSGSGSGDVGGGGNPAFPMHSFAKGGSIIARRPTVALFGEAGPELAEFVPLSQMQQAGGGRGPQVHELHFSGSAPPGIGITERDQIAGVLVEALIAGGINVRPGGR